MCSLVTSTQLRTFGKESQLVSTACIEEKLTICIAASKPRHKSSVINVRFDPQSSRVVASASADGTCYITSCYVKEADEGSTAGPFGGVTSYGETLLKLNTIGWVNSVSFSPDASTLAFASKLFFSKQI